MRVHKKKIQAFQQEIWDYYAAHARAMPWRETTDPYRIVISEIMLQQTQVDRVRVKYAEFIQAFSSFEALAKASVADVLKIWQGLGYNRRALMLKKMSEKVMTEFGGLLPSNPELLKTLPGIGKATAGSLAAFVFNRPVAFIETNIRRVFIHFFFQRHTHITDDDIMPLVQAAVDRKNARHWYYALMDYGTMLAKTTKKNPNTKSAHYVIQSKFEGSNRQIRGMILRRMLKVPYGHAAHIAKEINKPLPTVTTVLNKLVQEGFLTVKDEQYSIAQHIPTAV